MELYINTIIFHNVHHFYIKNQTDILNKRYNQYIIFQSEQNHFTEPCVSPSTICF